jgi:hypothetical protein
MPQDFCFEEPFGLGADAAPIGGIDSYLASTGETGVVGLNLRTLDGVDLQLKLFRFAIGGRTVAEMSTALGVLPG